MSQNLAIIILNWNGIEDTLELLKDLEKTEFGDNKVTIIVVDNASTDKSVEVLEKYKLTKGEFVLLTNKENLGFSGGNNVGIRYALERGADYVLILNNDTRLKSDLIVQLMKSAKDENNIGAVSPKIYFAKGFEFHKKYKSKDLGKVIWYAGGKIDWDNVYGQTIGVDEVDKGQFDKAKGTDFATGTCMLISREALLKAGLYDERYYLYYEDTDLSVRIESAGFKVIYTPSTYIWHKVAQSSGIGSELNDYYISRNRLLFGLKYAKLRTKFALFRESIKILFNGRKWQKRGVIDFYTCRLGRGSYK